MVDRRIDLFSLSLKKLGHETRLLYLEPPIGFEERFNADIHSIPVSDTPGADAPLAKGVFPPPPHVQPNINPFLGDSRLRRLRFEALYDAAKAQVSGLALKKRDIFRLSLAYPDLMRERLESRGQLGIFERLTSLLLGVFAFPILLPKFFAGEQSGYPTTAPSGVKLTPFDNAVLRHAAEAWTPDVVTANDFPTLRAAVTIKRHLGIPVIYDSHELYSYQPGVPPENARRIFAEERKLMDHIDGLIVMNELHAHIVERDFGYTGPYAICTNATNVPEGFDAKKRYNLFRERLPIPANHKIMMFQGGVNTGRRIDFLLRGLAKARRGDIHMVFLTWGSEVPSFREMAEDLGIGGRVHFLPFVDWDKVLFYAGSADCGFLPYQATDQNTSISSPNKMYEFIMSGTPMIGSSDLHYVNEIVGGNKFGVVRPLRADIDYALAIEEMFDESLGGADRFREALISKGPKFSWDNEVKPALKLYEMAAGKRFAPRSRKVRPIVQAERILVDTSSLGEPK